jgi:hypothetical protein
MDNEEPVTGQSGAEEPEWGNRLTPDASIVWRQLGWQPTQFCEPTRPDKYYPDGKPILDDDLLSATMKWALLFEQRDANRIVGQTRTLYGEKLSTIWLGLDHSFGHGPPLIFETMLFAPADKKKATRAYIFAVAAKTLDEEAAYDHEQAYIKKHYPHDQLCLRYSTRREAEDSHERLKLQCLIPPRWRHFILGRICGDSTWLDYDDEVREEWWH